MVKCPLTSFLCVCKTTLPELTKLDYSMNSKFSPSDLEPHLEAAEWDPRLLRGRVALLDALD